MLEDKVSFTLVQLAIFLTVARTGNMKTAALILNITQPAVSKSLNTLEQVWICQASFLRDQHCHKRALSCSLIYLCYV